jgi:hypothetical protein
MYQFRWHRFQEPQIRLDHCLGRLTDQPSAPLIRLFQNAKKNV